MSVAKTAAGVEGSLLIHPDGTLVTSATMTRTVGEMQMFLVPPEDSKWVRLDGSRLDTQKYPRLASAVDKDGKLPKIDYMWVYVG